MAQLALAVLPALGLGGTAAAGAGAAAAGIAGSAGLLSALSGVATLVGIIGTIGKGNADATTSRMEASQADLQAGQEGIQAAQHETDMKRQLLKVLGENDVAFAAGGTDTTQGIAADARASETKQADDQISIDREDVDFRKALLRARASNLRLQAGQQQGGALLTALGQGLNYGIDSLKTGA